MGSGEGGFNSLEAQRTSLKAEYYTIVDVEGPMPGFVMKHCSLSAGEGDGG
jgi:hypothetical protein